MKLFDLHPKEKPDELFGREAEINRLVDVARTKRWAAVLGPRMVGKTSLIKVACTVLRNEGFIAVYSNLWGTTDVKGLISAVVKGITVSENLFKKVQGFLNVEGITVGPQGPSVTFTKKPMQTVTDIFSIIGREGKDCVIALDEVHTLANISGPLIASLANVFNTYPNVTFLFSGSMFGLVKALLNQPASSPMYGRPPAEIRLKPFNAETSKNFLECGFKEYSIKLGQTNEVVERLDGFPGWLTLYGNNRTVLTQKHAEALRETIKRGSLITREEMENFLAGRNKKKCVAVLKSVITPSRWGAIKKRVTNELGYPINDERLNETLKALEDAMIIEKLEKAYSVINPLLKELLLEGKIDA